MIQTRLLFALLIFSISTTCYSQTSSLTDLAKKANVDLKVASNITIGFVVPAAWKPSMKSFDICRELLEAMPKRREIVINGPVNKYVLERLKQMAAKFEGNVKITRVPIVTLGIFCDVNSYEVAEVIKGSPIEESGVKIGDKIIKVGVKPTETIADLRRELCEYSPGNDIKLEVRRGDKNIKMSVKLSALPMDY